MSDLTVAAKVPANKEKGTKELGPCIVTVPTGATAAEMIQMFGDEGVKSNAEANWTVTLQSNIRSGLKKGKTPETIDIERSGKYSIDLKGLLEEEPIIIQKDGSYTIHLPSLFKMIDKEK